MFKTRAHHHASSKRPPRRRRCFSDDDDDNEVVIIGTRKSNRSHCSSNDDTDTEEDVKISGVGKKSSANDEVKISAMAGENANDSVNDDVGVNEFSEECIFTPPPLPDTQHMLNKLAEVAADHAGGGDLNKNDKENTPPN